MIRRFVLMASLVILVAVSTASADDPADWAKENVADLVTLYQEFHRAPELSFQERETARKLAAELESVGAKVTTGVGGHGVVALLENGPGLRVMVRTDLDALPVTEQTNLIYASQIKVRGEAGAETGVMHACGHDIHITSLIGVARYLAAHKDRWQGTVMFIGQPAEERGAGAKAMLEDGLFERFPKPDFAMALHVDSTLGAGRVGYRAGYALANTDSVDITIHGRGGHGAYPHTTIDPIVQAAHLVLDLQSIVSREIRPSEPAVITVGSIHGGTKHNVIGDSCKLQLTVRSYSEEVRQQLLKAIKRKALAAASSANAPEPTVEFSDHTPAMFNDEKLVERLRPIFEQVVGADHVQPSEPSLGGEDFSRYGLAGVPIFMFRLGSVEDDRLAGYRRVGQEPPSLHSSLYYPDAEPTLITGVAVMSASVLELLTQRP